MPDSASYGRPGLYSDGMSGGTDFFTVLPWDCHPRRRRRKARKAASVPIYRRIPDTS